MQNQINTSREYLPHPMTFLINRIREKQHIFHLALSRIEKNMKNFHHNMIQDFGNFPSITSTLF